MPNRGERMPEHELLELLTGAWKSRAVHAFVELGLPDLLGTPQDTRGLAHQVRADEPSLARLLALLVSLGLVNEDGGMYTLSPVGAVLRADHPRSMRSLTDIYGGEFDDAWRGLPQSVRDGRPAFTALTGQALYDYLDAHPDRLEAFAEAMAGSVFFDAFAASGAFGSSELIVDAGGGIGHLIGAVLRAHPEACGVLLERPSMLKLARPLLDDESVRDRCEPREGDFFTDDLPAGDTYILSRVLHDWSDGECVTILRNVRRALPDRGRLFIVERLLDRAIGDPTLARAFDLHMLVITGGRERTLDQYEQLLGLADLALVGVNELPMSMHAVEVAAI